MQSIFVFGGTTEGRLLCDFLERQQISAVVFVATEYGQQLLQAKYVWVHVHCGRLCTSEIVQCLSEQQPYLVIDATHPYATAVTANLQQACQVTCINYIRLLRPLEQAEDVQYFASLGELIFWLRQTEGIIFSTLGSKELPVFQILPNYQQRLVVRVLPNEEALAQCQKMGFQGRQIIAMQGPFSQEMNQLMFQEWQAAVLVTKEAGKAGGFWEKIAAAQACGLKIAVLKRPLQEDGLTLAEIEQVLLQSQKK